MNDTTAIDLHRLVETLKHVSKIFTDAVSGSYLIAFKLETYQKQDLDDKWIVGLLLRWVYYIPEEVNSSEFKLERHRVRIRLFVTNDMLTDPMYSLLDECNELTEDAVRFHKDRL